MDFILRVFLLMILGAAAGVGIFLFGLILLNPLFWVALVVTLILSLIFK